MATNGTFPATPPPALSQEAFMATAPEPRRHAEVDEPILSSTFIQHASSAINSPQGRSSRPNSATPSWNPAALLQPTRQPLNTSTPNGFLNQTSHPQNSPRQPIRRDTGDSVIFQFASTGIDSDVEPSTDSSTSGGHDAQNASHVGQWIERINNVQNRSLVPQSKRRKLDEEQNAQGGQAVQARGSGILGDYVQEKRNEANGSTLPQAPTVDLTDGNDDEPVVVHDPRDEEVCYGMIKTKLNCTRVPSPKPGMKSLLGPNFQPIIKVVLKRQAGDTSLKIQAYDHTREIIGHMEPGNAAAIVPLLDTNIHLRTDCRIPPQPKKQGEEPGQPTSRAYILDVVMYGPVRYAKNVGAHLNRHDLKLHAPHMVQKGIRVQNPHVLEYRPPPPKAYPTNGQGTLVSSSNRTVEEIRSEVLGVFDSLTRKEDLPSMDPDSSITTPLLKHQRQGLYFMTMREKPRRLHEGESSMVSFWQRKAGMGGQRLWNNVITGHVQRDEPPETRGGILADMMGLGKTLCILSLIASTTDAAREWDGLPPTQRPPGRSKPRHELMTAQPNLGQTPVTLNVKSTLLVCPLSTITNWEEQIKQHVRPGSLSYHIYHGSNRIKDPAKLAEFDLVITTYGSVSNELASRNKRKEGSYPLEKMGWFRIVLDEAHMIREQNTLQFKAIVRLHADRRWAVTGTPVQNRLSDLAALLGFLRLEPFDDRAKFSRYIVEPFKACDPEIVPKLRILVDTITLRRLKDKIDLPPRDDLVVKLDFSPEEQGIYDMFAKNAQDRVKVLAGNKDDGKALGGNTYIHILKAILRLRLLCAHGKDLLNDDDLATLQGMSAEMAIDIEDDEDQKPSLSDQKAHEMFTLMQETNSDACIECGKKLGSSEVNVESESQDDTMGYMTPCYHVVCRACIGSYQARAREMLQFGQNAGTCPVCQDYVRFEFVELRRKDVDAEHDGLAKAKLKGSGKKLERYNGPHTKTKALLEDLLKSKAASEEIPDEPPFKSVVFSGWTSHLDLIEVALNVNGISFTRLDGSMTRTARTAAMDSFRDNNDVHVILVSITAGGLGLNLTAGNNVYVMEPQYNPAAEAQAIDRVHRLGQKRPVRTVRYIMRGSFEEKMIELQEKKMKLASLSMDGQSKSLDKAEAARQKLMDLRSLFK